MLGRTSGAAALTTLDTPELAARAPGPPCVCVPSQAAQHGQQRGLGRSLHYVFKASTGESHGRHQNLCDSGGRGTQTADGIGDTQGADGARGRHPAPQALGRRPRDPPGAGRGGAGGEAGLGSSRTPAPGSCTRRLTPTRCPTLDARAFTVTVTPLLSSSRQQHRKRMGTATRARSPSHDK